MKLSEHIVEMQRLLHEHGDVEVFNDGGDGDRYEAGKPEYHEALCVWRTNGRGYEDVEGVLL